MAYEHMKKIMNKTESGRGNPSGFFDKNQLDVDSVHEFKRENNEPKITINSVLKKDEKSRDKKHVVF